MFWPRWKSKFISMKSLCKICTVLELQFRETAGDIAAAVAVTNQTYVDALKNAGKFDAAAQRFIGSVYSDICEYLTARIEAELRRQKGDTALALSVPIFGATNYAGVSGPIVV